MSIRPKTTWEELNLPAEGALAQLCELVPKEVIEKVPNLSGWLAHRKWWWGLTQEERHAILCVEWKYD